MKSSYENNDGIEAVTSERNEFAVELARMAIELRDARFGMEDDINAEYASRMALGNANEEIDALRDTLAREQAALNEACAALRRVTEERDVARDRLASRAEINEALSRIATLAAELSQVRSRSETLVVGVSQLGMELGDLGRRFAQTAGD